MQRSLNISEVNSMPIVDEDYIQPNDLLVSGEIVSLDGYFGNLRVK